MYLPTTGRDREREAEIESEEIERKRNRKNGEIEKNRRYMYNTVLPKTCQIRDHWSLILPML